MPITYSSTATSITLFSHSWYTILKLSGHHQSRQCGFPCYVYLLTWRWEFPTDIPPSTISESGIRQNFPSALQAGFRAVKRHNLYFSPSACSHRWRVRSIKIKSLSAVFYIGINSWLAVTQFKEANSKAEYLWRFVFAKIPYNIFGGKNPNRRAPVQIKQR